MRILRLISPKFNPISHNPNPQFLGFLPRNFTSPSTQQPSSPPPPPMPPSSPLHSDKIASIADEISDLTLLEVADLTTLLSKKLEVKDMPMVSLMMPGMGFSLRGLGGGGGGGAAGAAAKEEEKVEKTAFELKLEAGFDTASKIKIIKEVRTFTDLGLKEAKELVEKAPSVLKSGVPKDEALKIVEKMKAIGATIVME